MRASHPTLQRFLDDLDIRLAAMSEAELRDRLLQHEAGRAFLSGRPGASWYPRHVAFRGALTTAARQSTVLLAPPAPRRR